MIVGVAAIVFGLVTGTLFFLQWLGRLPRGRDPDALLERGYLLLPLSVASVLIGIPLLLEALGVAAAGRWALPLFVVAILLGAAGVVLWATQPQRLRPAWQRRQVERRRRHRARPHGSDADEAR